MKVGFSLVAFLLGSVVSSSAQISDDEPSKNYLAVQCAVSGGSRSVHDYEEYGRKLAKTVGLLSPGQQKTVFGYVPNPAATPVIPDYRPDVHGEIGKFGLASQRNPNGAEAPGVEKTSAPVSTGPLVNAVGNFNQALSGVDNSSAPIIAGAAPATTENNPEGTPKKNNRLSEWWAGVLVWIGTVLDQR